MQGTPGVNAVNMMHKSVPEPSGKRLSKTYKSKVSDFASSSACSHCLGRLDFVIRRRQYQPKHLGAVLVIIHIKDSTFKFRHIGTSDGRFVTYEKVSVRDGDYSLAPSITPDDSTSSDDLSSTELTWSADVSSAAVYKLRCSSRVQERIISASRSVRRASDVRRYLIAADLK